ncbi:MAG: hypothetical protein ACK4MG_15230 [Aquabacterium sp.]
MLALSSPPPWLRQPGFAIVVLAVVVAHAVLAWVWSARTGVGVPGGAFGAAPRAGAAAGIAVRTVRAAGHPPDGGSHTAAPFAVPLPLHRAHRSDRAPLGASEALHSTDASALRDLPLGADAARALASDGLPAPWASLPEARPLAEGPPGWLADFLNADDLDEPPRPLHGWVLDESALQQRYRARLTVAVWVSAEGVIVHVRPLSAEPNGPWALQAIAPLAATAMQPGYRHGEPRPARVVIEITSDDETVR